MRFIPLSTMSLPPILSVSNLSFVLLLLLLLPYAAPSCPPPPSVRISKAHHTHHPPLPLPLHFSLQTHHSYPGPPLVEILLSCQAKEPIRWIINVDYGSGEISHSYGSTWRRGEEGEYTANYSLTLPNPSKGDVFICTTFAPPTNCPSSRTILLLSVSTNPRLKKDKNVTLSLLPEEEGKTNFVLGEFDKQLEQRRNTNASSTACPITLTLRLLESNAGLVFAWAPPGGSPDIRSIKSPADLANANLFHPTIEEACINWVERDEEILENCSRCRQSEYEDHKFFPQLLSYTLGPHRRILKGYFDLDQRSFFYEWEGPTEWSALIAGQVASSTDKVLRGLPFSFQCFPSVFLFAHGTRMRMRMGKSLIHPLGIIEEEEAVDGGTYRVVGTFPAPPSTSDRLEIECAVPMWNSSEWVRRWFLVELEDSEAPSIFGEVEESFVIAGSSNFTITCEARGLPLPTLSFLLPKNNLDVFLQNETSLDEQDVHGNNSSSTTTPTVKLPLIIPSPATPQHEGDYVCRASNPLGHAEKTFRVSLYKEPLPQFLVILLISAFLFILIFAAVSSALLYKLKKEKKEFIRSTEEAIRRFQEGWKSSEALSFSSKGEYKDYEIPITRWAFGSTLLGSGAFGTVSKGIIHHGERRQDVVAVKRISAPRDVKDFENSLMELTIMSYIGKHENVVSLIGACTEHLVKRSLIIGVEYCANGDLLAYLRKRRSIFRSFVSEGRVSLDSITARGSYANIHNSSTFNTIDLYKWAYQIANGMDYIVSKRILHCDLATRNILLTKDNICKISDFGLSRQLLNDNYTKTSNVLLPWRWMSPESLKYRSFSSASDVYAYGVVLWELFSLGEEPWRDFGWTEEFMEELERGRRLPLPPYSTSNMYDKIMLETWALSPSDRPSFSDARAFFETAIAYISAPEGKEDHLLNAHC